MRLTSGRETHVDPADGFKDKKSDFKLASEPLIKKRSLTQNAAYSIRNGRSCNKVFEVFNVADWK
jgi:hypothetical protein